MTERKGTVSKARASAAENSGRREDIKHRGAEKALAGRITFEEPIPSLIRNRPLCNNPLRGITFESGNCGLIRKLPPFAAVRAFEAAARLGSIKEASEELCLTASAVSHQIRALEEYLDTSVFRRSGNRVELTLTGRAYAGKLTTLLDTFEESTRSAKEAALTPFRVHCTPGFAARWLVPRLDRLAFCDRVRISVSNGAPSTDFGTNSADVVIQWADAPVSAVVTEPLMQSARYPVVSPSLIQSKGLHEPGDLCRMTLMHDETMDAWGEWFEAAGIDPPAFPRGPTFPNCELATTAAERGQGVALAYDAVVRSTVESGALVRLFDAVTMPFVIYSVSYPSSRKSDPMVREFSDWIHSEAKAAGVEARTHLICEVASGRASIEDSNSPRKEAGIRSKTGGLT